MAALVQTLIDICVNTRRYILLTLVDLRVCYYILTYNFIFVKLCNLYNAFRASKCIKISSRTTWTTNYVHNGQKITCISVKKSTGYKQIQNLSFKEWTPLFITSTLLTRLKLLHAVQFNDIKLHIDQVCSEQVYNPCPPSEKTNLLFLSTLQRQVES